LLGPAAGLIALGYLLVLTGCGGGEGNTSQDGRSPVLDPIGSQTVVEGQTLTFTVTATDPDGPKPILTASNLPSGARFADHGNGTGSFSWTPALGSAGTYSNVTFTATDAVDASLKAIRTVSITVKANQPPVLNPVGDQTVVEGQTLDLTVTASDPNGASPTLSANNLPSGAQFTDNGNGTGTLNWTPPVGDTGAFSDVTFTATDAVVPSLTTKEAITITVDANQPPVFSPVGDQTIVEGQTLMFMVTATDPNGTAPILGVIDLPVGASFSDHGDGTGTFSWTPSAGAARSYPNVTFVATDAVDPTLKVNEVITITVSAPPDLQHYWQLNESAGPGYSDLIGGLGASCGTACPTAVAGVVSGAQQFDGSSSELNVAHDSSFDWSSGARFSIEFWMKESACTGRQAVVGRHDAATQLHWWVGCEDGNAAFYLFDRNGVGPTQGVIGTSNVADGSWHHVVAVRDSIRNENQLYVDGVKEAVVAASYGADFDGTTALNIGWLNDSAGDYHFGGVIDELALRGRVLSDSALQRDYRDGTMGLRRGYWGCSGGPIRIMPLGDSITRRVGYRPGLYTDLVNAGYDVDFVGSNNDGCGTVAACGYDADQEGHSGYDTSEIAASLPGWLNLNPPEVVLLHIGTNEDPAFPYPDPTKVGDILNIIDGQSPAISVVLARIINGVPYNPLITQFNDNVYAMAQTRISNGDKIIWVDMEHALNYVDDMESDGIHPNAAGFAKMVPVWFAGLQQFLPACVAVVPRVSSSPVTSASVGTPYRYTVQTTGYPRPSFSLQSAPAGMSIHPDTGEIQWTPGSSGSYNATVQVQNAHGSDMQSFTVNVN
jgi:hypothetical protein